jgi:hypothetical protein
MKNGIFRGGRMKYRATIIFNEGFLEKNPNIIIEKLEKVV